MTWLKKVFGWLAGYFKSGHAVQDAKQALEFVGKALPYVVIVGDVTTKYLIHTPAEVDDITWAAFKKLFNPLFDGNEHTPAEIIQALKLRGAAWLLAKKYPQLNTSVAVLATQSAYLDYKQGVVA